MCELVLPEAYELKQESQIREIGIKASVLEHKKSGARVILMPCSDENKVFCIGFRTPPADSTGVPHILEHSVLCGSEKYPLKDPFVELMKSSLNTFLNAMTYPDKTLYPVASCNDKDFANLMDVYLDAVFHPMLHQDRRIFEQEGWRYEIADKNDPLTLNGVVLSEMQGAYSSVDEMAFTYAQTSLFPDTCYGVDSGGDPSVIPSLGYEDFCGFHRNLYHPSNSYILLYGNMDMAERLDYLDREYLAAYERKQINSAVMLQKPFTARKDLSFAYPLEEGEPEEERNILSLQWAMGNILDARTVKALSILDSVLLQNPGAPLRQALLDAGIGKDISGGYSGYTLQPFYTVTARDAAPGLKDKMLEVTRSTLEKLVREGLNRRSITAALSSAEFQTREADYGGYPKGLIYGMEIFKSWLYDGEDPFLHLRYEDDFAYMREHTDDGYFEGLLQKYFLDNRHMSFVELYPQKGKAETDAEKLARKLEAHKRSLSEAALDELIGRSLALKAYQEAPEDPEKTALIPRLTLSDLEPSARKLENTLTETEHARFVYRFRPTSGIAYVTVSFDCRAVRKEHIPWLGLLKACFGVVSTEHYDYRELFDEQLAQTGSCGLTLDTYGDLMTDTWEPAVSLSVKFLNIKLNKALDLMEEILLRSDYSDSKRLKEILEETILGLRQRLVEAGHAAAVRRSGAAIDEANLWEELTSGISFYRFLCDLEIHFDEEKARISETLKTVAEELFIRGGLMINLTAEKEAFPKIKEALDRFAAHFPERKDRCFALPSCRAGDEGFRISGDVGYVAVSGSYRKAGSYTGVLRVLRSILSSDYLWKNLRVLGGAYGAMCAFLKTGSAYMVSYRDPNLGKTLEAYRGVPQYLRTADLKAALPGFI